jgi:hypothetical protein
LNLTAQCRPSVKYILIFVAGVTALLVTVLVLSTFTHFFDNRTRSGHFDIYTTPKTPDSVVFSVLYYKRHLLTDRLNDYSLDPNSPDRILFASDNVFHGARGICGTFLFDGQSKQLTQLRRWPAHGDWSPDSKSILFERANHPSVRDLATRDEITLTEWVSAKGDGKFLELSVFEWSPDSHRLAGEVRVLPVARPSEFDWDLVEITLTPLSFQYLATLRGGYPGWTTDDIGWSDGRLQSAPSSKHGSIVVKPPEGLGWTTAPPSHSIPSSERLDRPLCPALER